MKKNNEINEHPLFQTRINIKQFIYIYIIIIMIKKKKKKKLTPNPDSGSYYWKQI